MAALGTRHQRVRKVPQTTRWSQVRSQGRSRFIWYYGVLGVGVPIAIFKVFFDLFSWGAGFPVLDAILTVVLLPIVGLLVGFLTWSISERRFQKRQKLRGAEEFGKVG